MGDQTKTVSQKKKTEKGSTKVNFKAYLILGVVGLLVSVFMLGLGIQILIESHLDTFDHNYVYDGYSQMDIIMLSDPFYVFDDESKAYMAIDKLGALNVVRLYDSQANEMSDVQNSTLYENGDISSITPHSVQGRYVEISEHMRNSLVEAYNEMLNTEDMTYGMSVKTMGVIYLDATQPASTRSPWIYLGLGAAMLALSLYFIIINIVQIHRRRRRSGHTTKEDPRLEHYDVRIGYELQSNVALTTHAVVDLSDKEGPAVFIAFSNILWMYSTRKNRPLGGSEQLIVLALSDGTTKEIASLPTSGAGNQIYLEIFSDIRDRVPNILVGFSDENQIAYEQKVKELEGAPEEDAAELDLIPEGDGTTNSITGGWQEGDDILPADWDPDKASEEVEEEIQNEIQEESESSDSEEN